MAVKQIVGPDYLKRYILLYAAHRGGRAGRPNDIKEQEDEQAVEERPDEAPGNIFVYYLHCSAIPEYHHGTNYTEDYVRKPHPRAGIITPLIASASPASCRR
jgi:hypothetical protein